MKITSHPVYISSTLIDSTVWHIKKSIMDKYGYYQADADIAPLRWYINSGRATLEFLHKLVEAKPFMIGRKLHEGGSYEEAIERVCKYLRYERYV